MLLLLGATYVAIAGSMYASPVSTTLGVPIRKRRIALVWRLVCERWWLWPVPLLKSIVAATFGSHQLLCLTNIVGLWSCPIQQRPIANTSATIRQRLARTNRCNRSALTGRKSSRLYPMWGNLRQSNQCCQHQHQSNLNRRQFQRPRTPKARPLLGLPPRWCTHSRYPQTRISHRQSPHALSCFLHAKTSSYLFCLLVILFYKVSPADNKIFFILSMFNMQSGLDFALWARKANVDWIFEFVEK